MTPVAFPPRTPAPADRARRGRATSLLAWLEARLRRESAAQAHPFTAPHHRYE
jgi:hypothetical protein